jgi:hypothetical protein
LQLCLASVLFLWFVALRVGMERVFSTPSVWPQLGACALGLLVTYVCSASVRAVQAGRLSIPRVLPQMIAGGALTVASLFFLGDGFDEQQAADGKVRRPPSLPYAGLLSELHKRKQGKEISGREGGDENGELAGEPSAEEEALWCEKPEAVEAPACEGGRAWEEALACLPAPTAVAAQKTKVTAKRRRAAPEEPLIELAEPLPEGEPLARPWALTLGLSTLITLLAMWLLSLLGVFLQLRARAPVRPAASELDDLSEAPEEARIGASDDALTAAERDALKSELDQAKAALVALSAERSGASAGSEERFVNTQRELELVRAALESSEITVEDLKRELAHVREELAQGVEQRDQLRNALMELRARRLDGRADNDTGERGTGTMRQPQPAERGTGTMRQPQPAERGTGTMRQPQPAERSTGLTRQLAEGDHSSYSLSQVQEERVTLGKRHKP